jgi:hypothetical protein
MELLITSAAIFVIYLVTVYLLYGMTKSVSATYYELRYKWVFTMVLWGFSIPLIIAASQPLIFLSGAAICFTGAAPGVDEKMERNWHIGSSVAGIIIGLLALWIHYGYWEPVAIQLAFTVPAKIGKMKHHTYWIEVLAFALVWISVFMNV